MKNATKLIVLLALMLNYSFTIAQETTQNEELSLDSGTIDSQFEYIFRKSGNFKGTNGQKYEAVKYSSLLTLKAHVLDSLKTTYAKLNSSEKTVNNQAKEIESLKSQLSNTQTELTNTNAEKDSMSLFGMQMSKTGYNVLMWGIIAGLLALALLFVFRFKSSNSSTKAAKRKLEEVEVEFEEHRRVALEREQKVRRQLQDEINKNKS
ncbi:tRNA (guanine-N1)-methyltransferase [uncultured Winogradskyella sp.]|uniref:tRNA (guanine-N1)-methyltransferase n=1 Tax=uncultured Winogradskyella sp. TaxID=395353 RepID=UPI0026284650|nr:tRNA (guanine-N1)-methyltransferase [uncultured Winogradskyella sp.]